MFKLWLESNDIKIPWVSSDGSEVRISFPSGVYEYKTDYGPVVLRLLRQNKFKPGNFANELKKLVSKGFVTVQKIQ